MRFTKVSIRGYGRFSDKELEPDPGLQIIAGPNEQGKSTLRHFIADMLYGQKRSASQRVYEDSNELRTPWNKVDGYGGRLDYTLDSGRALEVQRSFDRQDEWTRVFDHTNARDITADFEALKNRESRFAERHLGISKEVFLSVATISHLTLEDLGDKQALLRIREKLISLTGSGSEKSSAEEAVKRLSDRIASIGQQTARTKPLPIARARMIDLQKEFEQVSELREEITGLEARRRTVLGNLDNLIKRRTALERELQAYEQTERAKRLKKAEALTARVNEITKACFGMAAVRDFPLEKVPDVRSAATLQSNAENQVRKTEEEWDALRKRVEEEAERLGPDAALDMAELDPELETQLAEVEGRIHRLQDKLAELGEESAKEEARNNEARKDLSTLPDFSKLSADPVEWLTQIASSFGAARRARDGEEGKRGRLSEGLREKREALDGPASLFESFEDFPTAARDFESNTRARRDFQTKAEQEADALRQRGDELKAKIPGFKIFAFLSLAAVVVTVGVALQTGNPGIYIPSFFFALMLFFSLVSVLITRNLANRALKRLKHIDGEKENSQRADEEERKPIEALMERAECDTVRELEALFDHCRELSVEVAVLEQQSKEQDELFAQAAQRVTQLYERLRETFLLVGEELKDEDTVQGAAMRAIGRYQEYRDAKRRAMESRNNLERNGKDIEDLDEELGRLKEEDLKRSLEVRKFLRDNHYADEQKSDSALKALRGYRIKGAQTRQKRGELGLLQGKFTLREQQRASERADLAAQENVLNRLLAEAGAATFEEYQGKAEQAKDYQDLRKERAALDEQLSVLLGGEDLTVLRKAVEADGPPPEFTVRPKDELKGASEAASEAIDALRKQEHALHISMTERGAGTRTLNEVEEERAGTERRVRELELELQAAGYAAAIIEEVTRERHSRIAPRLAELASAYLREITGGAYEELLVNHDLEISIRIPQIKTLSQNPERQLSKGTVDQIYLALRLAMAQCIGDGRESIPMLLDDPFANYDDTRLTHAMNLLARIGETNQILLFTCRDDVVRAAREVQAPIIRL